MCSETYVDAKFSAELDHLVGGHVGDVFVLFVEVLGELGVLDLRVVDRRQWIDYLHIRTPAGILPMLRQDTD